MRSWTSACKYIWIYINKKTQMFAQTGLCMHEWCQSWLMTSCFQPMAMKFGMWVYNDCANIFISKKTQKFAQTWLCMHDWCQS